MAQISINKYNNKLQCDFIKNFSHSSYYNDKVKCVKFHMESYYKLKDVLSLLGYEYNKKSIQYTLSKVDSYYKKRLLDLVKLYKINPVAFDSLELHDVYLNKTGIKMLINLPHYSINNVKRVLDKAYKCYTQCVIDKSVKTSCFWNLNFLTKCHDYKYNKKGLEVELKREEFIKSKLNCKFYKYNSKKRGFTTLSTICDIVKFTNDMGIKHIDF